MYLGCLIKFLCSIVGRKINPAIFVQQRIASISGEVVNQIAVRLTQLLLGASTEILILKFSTCVPARIAYPLINITPAVCSVRLQTTFKFNHYILHRYVSRSSRNLFAASYWSYFIRVGVLTL